MSQSEGPNAIQAEAAAPNNLWSFIFPFACCLDHGKDSTAGTHDDATMATTEGLASKLATLEETCEEQKAKICALQSELDSTKSELEDVCQKNRSCTQQLQAATLELSELKSFAVCSACLAGRLLICAALCCSLCRFSSDACRKHCLAWLPLEGSQALPIPFWFPLPLTRLAWDVQSQQVFSTCRIFVTVSALPM